MDLNKRLDQVDDELKLLKNEIKNVLLEIQEQVLSVQNPFTEVAASLAAAQAQKSTEIIARSEAQAGSGPFRDAPPPTLAGQSKRTQGPSSSAKG